MPPRKISDKEAKRLIEVFKAKPLSDHDITKITGGRCNVILYNQLKDYEHLTDAMGENGCCVILYQTSVDFGHWICVLEHKNGTLEVFDSLGMKPDAELKYVPDELYSGKLLSYMIVKGEYKKVIYNKHKLQRDKTSNCCGKWCVIRMMFKQKSLPEFIDMFTNDKAVKSGTSDFLCSCLYFMLESGILG
jgi:hypothetical protein